MFPNQTDFRPYADLSRGRIPIDILIGATTIVPTAGWEVAGAALRAAFCTEALLRNTICRSVAGLVGVVGVVSNSNTRELEEHTTFTNTRGQAAKRLKVHRTRAKSLHRRDAMTFSFSSCEVESRIQPRGARLKTNEDRLPIDLGLQASML